MPRRKQQRQSEDEATDISNNADDFFPPDPDEIDDPSDETFAEYSVSRRGKRRKVDNPAPRGRGRGRGAGSRGRGARRNVTENADLESNSLFEIVRIGRGSLQSVVDDWIENYKQDRDAALLDLMQFFIECAGCKGRITSEMQQSMEHAQIIRKMTEEFKEESGDYPLITSGPQWKKFKTNYCEFVQVLVKQCQYSIIYDQYLMDNVISLLTGLSDSQVRAFRHTATLAAMKLMTALVDVALSLSITLDNTQRQYESERQKIRDKRTTERLEMFMAKRQEIEENVEEIKNMLTYMFKSIFVHRYRDTLPEVRSICMTEIGQWMKKFHQQFLDDSYLKYIGWTLHDKVGDTRLKCLQALLPLYASEELTSKLELFTNKFKDRIINMTLDKEYDVAVHAVKLVISIHKHHQDILSDKDCEHVYELVYSSHRAVAQAAGEFLNERLFQPDEEVVQGLRTKRGKKRSVNTPLIRDLVQFFIESELHEHGAYLVDSLIESNPMMKDWECMTDLLLEEPGENEEGLDDRQETSLIEIMVCCIKQSATGEPPVGRGPNRKNVSAKEQKQVQDDKVKLTEHFIQTLPQLLVKYSADTEKVANLMVIPQYFDLDIYTQSRQEKSLDLLLKQMFDIFTRVHNIEVLEACTKTYAVLCADHLAIHSRSAVARGTLIDHLIQKYRSTVSTYGLLNLDEVDEEASFRVKIAMDKICVMYHCHDLGPYNIWREIFDTWVLSIVNNEERPPLEEVAKSAINCCHVGLLWERNNLDESAPNPERVAALGNNIREFMRVMREIMTTCNKPLLQEEAYVTICDNLMNYSKLLTDSGSSGSKALQPLVYEPDSSLTQALSAFVQQKVFIEEDDDDQDEHTKIEELHKRRNFLASFCKLVVYNVLPIKTAHSIFKHYVKFYNDYGDIIKATLGKAREINKVICAKTMALSLTTLFDDLIRDPSTGVVSKYDENFLSIKELAKRFALSFGLDQQKNKEAVMALHREGISYAVKHNENTEVPLGTPPNVAFLEILCEFNNKLTKPDKRTILSVLDQSRKIRFPGTRSDEWQPLLMYRNSLVQGDTDVVQARQPGRQYRGRKKVADDVGEDDHDPDSEPDADA